MNSARRVHPIGQLARVAADTLGEQLAAPLAVASLAALRLAALCGANGDTWRRELLAVCCKVAGSVSNRE